MKDTTVEQSITPYRQAAIIVPAPKKYGYISVRKHYCYTPWFFTGREGDLFRCQCGIIFGRGAGFLGGWYQRSNQAKALEDWIKAGGTE